MSKSTILSVCRRLALLCLAAALVASSSGCLFSANPTPSVQPTATPTSIPVPEAMVTFRVRLPAPLPAGDSVYMTELDEVTGLALNPTHHRMEAEDPQTYFVMLPYALGSVIKYRYTRQGVSNVQEHITDGRAVRYRMYHVEGPGKVDDILPRWTDTAFSGASGRISGQVRDASTGAPIPSILVAAGGAHTLSGSDGTFLIEGLPPGTHNLVAYSLDGAYHLYQQGAFVAAGATTPADITLALAPRVRMVFVTSVPKDSVPPTVPLRLAGNLLQLGNTFGDLAGGVSTLASRMPALTALPDGRYSVSLDLPAGADIRYKYTLGDGLWNSEHLSAGGFQVRQLIVPEAGMVLEDRVETWTSGGLAGEQSAAITFDTTVPADTPAGEIVAIQFNPGFGWMEPVPMWPAGANRWIFVLYGPLDSLGAVQYRYCRNEQCGSADDIRTAGVVGAGRSASSGLLPQTMDDPVSHWIWLDAGEEAATLPNIAITPHGAQFVAGVSFSDAYAPTWEPYLPSAFGDIKSLNANFVVLRPTWTFTRQNEPVLEPLPGFDPLWPDLVRQVSTARSQGLNVILFPTADFPSTTGEWWQDATRDFSWWLVWFDRYRNFILNQADLAQQQGAGALVMGGEWLSPALPGGTLPGGEPSGVPADAEARWRGLIQEVRGRYQGTLLWALPYPQGVQNPPAFLDSVDMIYLLWSAPLADRSDASETEMAARAGDLLDLEVLPIQQRFGKSVILAVAYPSAQGGVTGCIPASGGGCWGLDALARPHADLPDVNRDLQEQVRAYNAIFLAVNDRPWIAGLVSTGYYPPAPLQDKSASVHGKPARGVLWYWFPRLAVNPQ